MIDVIDLALPVFKTNQNLDDRKDVFLPQHTQSVIAFQPQARVHLDPSNRGKIIPFTVEKQAVEHSFSRFRRRRLTGTHDPVNIHQGFVAGAVLINGQRITDIGADRCVVDSQGLHRLETNFLELGQQFLGNLVARFGENFTGFLINDVFRDVLIDKISIVDQLLLETFILQLRRGA